jgi:hypothetical protein
MAAKIGEPCVAIQTEFTPPIGIAWIPMFLSCHPQLKTKLSHSIEASHIKEVTKERVIDFFQEFCRVIQERNIKLENIYNVDETGLILLYSANSRLLSWYNSRGKRSYRYYIVKQLSGTARATGMSDGN